MYKQGATDPLQDDTSTAVSDDTHGNGPAPGNNNLDNAEAAVFINNYPVSSF